MILLTLLFVLLPFIPGVRSIPQMDPRAPADLARLLPGAPALTERAGRADRTGRLTRPVVPTSRDPADARTPVEIA